MAWLIFEILPEKNPSSEVDWAIAKDETIIARIEKENAISFISLLSLGSKRCKEVEDYTGVKCLPTSTEEESNESYLRPDREERQND